MALAFEGWVLRLRTPLVAALAVSVLAAGCARIDEHAADRASNEQIAHDKGLESIITCGGGVFEDWDTPSGGRTDIELLDGAQMLIAIGHRIGYAKESELLGLGSDGSWLRKQFDQENYKLVATPNGTVRSTAYLMALYLRRYCTDHPFDTMADAINQAVDQIKARSIPK